MGVDFKPCILPRRRTLMPTSEQIGRLVDGLRDGRWVAADAEKSIDSPWSDGELRLVIPVSWGTDGDNDSGLRRMLLVDDEHPSYFRVEILAATDFVSTFGNNVDDDAHVRCACSEELTYRPRSLIRGVHARTRCPKCERPYDPAEDAPATVYSDTSYERSAGWRDGRFPPHPASPIAHSYARLFSHLIVAVDFEKDWPVLPDGQYLTLDPELVRLCESTFEEPFEVVNLFI
jgi:hypothetical protein